MKRRLWTLCALGLGACARLPAGQIVNTRDLAEADSRPAITVVQELGGADIMVPGNIAGVPGDGVAVVGEGLWIQGTAFGRQPTVLIGGLPAFVQARTADAGIVVRVPPGVGTGPQTLQVRTRAGVAEVPLNVRRFAAAWTNDGALQWLAMPVAGKAPAPVVASSPSVTKLAFSSDGRAAYSVDAAARRLTVFDVTTQKGPASAFALELEGTPVLALAAAADAPVLAIVRAHDVMVLRTSSAVRPPRGRPRALPDDIAEALAGQPVVAAVSPDGRFLALPLDRGNRVVLLSLQNSDAAPVVASVVVDPSVRAPSLIDLGFSVEGDTLWVASGARAGSESLGVRPTRVQALTVQSVGDGVKLTLGKSYSLPAGEPTTLGVSRTRPLPSGAAIRRPPQLAQVMVAALTAEGTQLFAVGAEGPVSVSSAPGRMTDVLIEPLGQVALASVVPPEGGVKLHWLRADGRQAEASNGVLFPTSVQAKTCTIEVQP